MNFVFTQHKDGWKDTKELKHKKKSKQPIDLDLINVDQIVVSDKLKHSDGGFKCFVGYKEGEIVKPYVLSYLK